MKVLDTRVPGTSTNVSAIPLRRPEGGSRPASARAPATDRVQVSAGAAMLADAVAVDSPEIEASADPERLAELRDAVAAGKLAVDARALARAIIREDAMASRQGGGR